MKGIADIYATLGSWENGVLEPDEANSKASLFAARALEIDPELPEAHTTLAYTALHHDVDLPVPSGWVLCRIRQSYEYMLSIRRRIELALSR